MQKVWAWWFAGVLAYIPANTYTMLESDAIDGDTRATILAGVSELIQYKYYGIAAIVFIASIFIPLAKFFVIAYLAISAQVADEKYPHRRLHLYHIVEFIGRWSMIDVFVVALLAALVQLDFLETVRHGPATVFFALSVIFTMLSAQSFDSRLIWDADGAAQHD